MVVQVGLLELTVVEAEYEEVCKLDKEFVR